jgi:hypothetical protein
MRVISQNGTMDFPYDNSLVFLHESCIKGNTCVEIQLCGDTEIDTVAEYSTEEKAIKAMEMLREKYLSRMELDGGYDIVNKCYVQPNYWVLPKVFQFPHDDEIEV